MKGLQTARRPGGGLETAASDSIEAGFACGTELGRSVTISASTKTAKTEELAHGWGIRQRLMALVVLVAALMLIAAAAIVVQLAQSAGAARREEIGYTAKSIQAAVDAQLKTLIVIGRIFSTSPSLERGEFGEFRSEAERAMQNVKDIWIVVADPAGQQLVNLAVPAGAPLARRVPEGVAAQTRAFETKQPEVSNIFSGAFRKKPIVTVEIPTFRNGIPLYVVAVAMDVTRFLDLLSRDHLPEGWLTGILDRRGDFIARALDHERMVGKPAAAGWRAIMHRDGLFEFTVTEGDTIIEANVVSPLSGWAIGVGVSKTVFEAPLWRGLWESALAGGVIALLGVFLAALLARSISRPGPDALDV